MRTYLDFEKPIAELESKVAELKALAGEQRSVSIEEELSRLEAKAREALWWGAEAATDRLVDVRFGDLRRHAIAGELSSWLGTPRGRLAAIILVDQFSRSIHRGTIAAFSSDPIALHLCNQGLDRGDDAALAPLLTPRLSVGFVDLNPGAA